MHPKFYENDFTSTSIKELEYVRSPFYDLGMHEHMAEGKEATKFIEKMVLKIEMNQFLMSKLKSQFPTKQTVAFTRYADEVQNPEYREKL